MDDLFADRHRDVSIQPHEINLEARWTAVETLAANLGAEQTAQVAEVAYGNSSEVDDEWLRRPFKDAEPAFAMRGNNAEMAMLSGCVLDQVIREGLEKTAILAAYLCELSAALGWTEPFDGLTETATNRLRVLAIKRRTPKPAPPVAAPTLLSKALKDALVAVKAQPGITGELFDSVVAPLVSETQKTLNAMTVSVRSVASWAEARVAIAEEETDLLYWLLSGHSNTLNVPWASLPPRTVAIVGARELAERVALLPEPPQARALLTQLLRMAGPESAEEAQLDAVEPPAALARFFAIGKPEALPDLAHHAFRQALALRAWKAAGDEQ